MNQHQANNDFAYVAGDYHTQRHAITEKAFDLVARYRADKFRAFVNVGADVLEFGCGPGWNLIQLPARRKVGYDVSLQYAPELAAQGIEFTSNLDSLTGQQFDFILFSHVLEHLVDPVPALVGVKALLKKGGTLLVIVPFDRPGSTYDPAHNNHHLYMWDVQSLTELLMACGFNVSSCSIGEYGFDRRAASIATHYGFGYGVYRALLRIMRTLRPGREIRAVLNLAGGPDLGTS